MIRLARAKGRLTIQLPLSFYDLGTVDKQIKESGFAAACSLRRESSDLILELRAPGRYAEKIAQHLFSRLNDRHSYMDADIATFNNSRHPTVSCVIILTANDIFLRTHLIPSIIYNSKGQDIEIVIVYNGIFADLSRLRNFQILDSEFGCVSKAYNEGARRAKAEYLALFHDDCIVADPDWINKSLLLLQNGYTAVSPEIDNILNSKFLNVKNVPLVIKKNDFFQMGAYDENYYLGYEDLDFTHTMLSQEKHFAEVKIRYSHLKGMSTVIMHSQKAYLFRHLFGLGIIPETFLKQLRQYYLGALQKTPEMQLLVKRELLYFMDKFKRYFINSGQSEVIKRERAFIDALAPGMDTSFMQDREDYIEFYRGLVNNGPAQPIL